MDATSRMIRAILLEKSVSKTDVAWRFFA